MLVPEFCPVHGLIKRQDSYAFLSSPQSFLGFSLPAGLNLVLGNVDCEDWLGEIFLWLKDTPVQMRGRGLGYQWVFSVPDTPRMFPCSLVGTPVIVPRRMDHKRCRDNSTHPAVTCHGYQARHFRRYGKDI